MDHSPMKKLVIPSTMGEALKVQQAILAEAQGRGFSENAIFAIRLARDEALSNAIRHGNCSDPAKPIKVDYLVDDEEVRVSICDEGRGFNPDALPDPTLEANLDRPHGRGVMLMKAYMTRVDFNERGNCVTLVKNRRCQRPPKE